ncbi:glycosyltransferase family 2 protein [Deferrisoma sp.]
MTGWEDRLLSLFDYLFGAGFDRTLRLFWHFFFLDFPRYLVTDVLLIAYLWLYRPVRPRPADDDAFGGRNPLVSVVIPVLNEEDTIFRTVESLQDQTYRPIEIVLVDDGSTDRTPEVCAEIQKRFPNVRFFRNVEREGKSPALNLGAGYAKGEVFVFVDSDTTFDRDAIAHLVNHLRDPRVGCVAGNVRVRNPRENLLTELQNMEYGFAIAVGRRIRAAMGTLPIVSGAFGAFRREVFEAVGGYDPGPGNDSDLTAKFRKLGYRVSFAPEAICMTNVPTRLSALFRQRRRWARNLAKNRIFKHGDVFSPFRAVWRPENAVSSADSVFFHVVLAFTSLAYLIDMVLHYPSILPWVILGNYVLYFLAEVFEAAVMIGFSERPGMDARSLVYLPLFNLYKRLLKFARVSGYLEEILFKGSYRDPFAPAKVRPRMDRW